MQPLTRSRQRAAAPWLAVVVLTLTLSFACGDDEPDNEIEGTVPPASALVEAVRSADAGAVARLLAQGADPDAKDPAGTPVVLLATQANAVDVARVLIDAGADVNAKDGIDDSAYLYAAAEGRLEILRLTLERGADLRATNRFGGTGLIPAAHHGHVETVRELLKTAVAIDHVNNLGWTALLEAIVLGDGGPAHTEIVRLLVAAGADINLADRSGVRPLAHARQRGQTTIVSILQRAGARE